MAAPSLTSRVKIQMTVSEDSTGKDILFQRQDGTYVDQDRADLTEVSTGTLTLASSASYTDIPIGGITTIKQIYIECDATALNIKLNGSGAIACSTVSGDRFKLYLDANHTTTPAISQTTGSNMLVHYCLVGT